METNSLIYISKQLLAYFQHHPLYIEEVLNVNAKKECCTQELEFNVVLLDRDSDTTFALDLRKYLQYSDENFKNSLRLYCFWKGFLPNI